MDHCSPQCFHKGEPLFHCHYGGEAISGGEVALGGWGNPGGEAFPAVKHFRRSRTSGGERRMLGTHLDIPKIQWVGRYGSMKGTLLTTIICPYSIRWAPNHTRIPFFLSPYEWDRYLLFSPPLRGPISCCERPTFLTSCWLTFHWRIHTFWLQRWIFRSHVFFLYISTP